MARKGRRLGHRAPHEDDGRRPTDDLVHRGGSHRLEVVQPDLALVGVLGQGPQPLADGIAGGLVAGHEQQDEERGQLDMGERLAVDIGLDQRGGEVA